MFNRLAKYFRSKTTPDDHPLARGCFQYFLKHRQSGEIIELGSNATLKPEDAVRHGLPGDNWGKDWEFCSRRL